MTLESIVANAALECNYKYDPATKQMIATLYESTTGKKAPAKKSLIRWFLENYQFNSNDGTWYHRDRVLVH